MLINRTEFLRRASLLIISFIILVLCLLNINASVFVSVILLLADIYSMRRHRNNIFLFFIFLAIAYFDVSVLISKYISSTPTLIPVYNQANEAGQPNIFMVCISMLTIFHLMVEFFLPTPKKEIKNELVIKEACVENKKRYALLSIVFTFVLAIVLMDFLVFNTINLPRTIYEYLLIIFIFDFYLIKKINDKFLKYLIGVLALLSAFISAKEGGRVIAMQPLIGYLFMFYSDKITCKRLIIMFVGVVILYTVLGIYGDYLEYGISFNNLNINVFIDAFVDRKLTLDTSISAYWTGMANILTANNYSLSYRFNNFLDFTFKYSILGAKANYAQIYDLSRENYIHYYGGYLFSYFYFWFGYLGSFICGFMIGKYLNVINKLKDKNSDFRNLLTIYLVASLPRWYLYFPVPLFRGMLIFVIIYFILYKLLLHKD